MSEVTAKVSKPVMRRLLHNQIGKNLLATGVSVVIAGLYMRFVFGDGNKKDYANFYKLVSRLSGYGIIIRERVAGLHF